MGLLGHCLLALALPAHTMGTCAGDSDAETCAVARDDMASLLQVHSHAPAPAPPCWSWRVSAQNAGDARTCDEICRDYGTTCVQQGFQAVGSASAMEAAHKMATGSPCSTFAPPQPSGQPYAPYVNLGFKSVCYYPSGSGSTCSARSQVADSRLCPCSTVSSAPPQCVQLSGTFCGGKDIGCDCNYCDDFKQDTRCANACRVMNGYLSSPLPSSSWQAHRNRYPATPAGNCGCSWMANNGGLGDNCKQCDTCAYECRKRNPFPQGTCR